MLRTSTVLLASGLLIALALCAWAFPERASASILGSGSEKVSLLQTTNTSMVSARQIPLNSSSTVAFDSNDSPDNRYFYYWYKFKTSSRNSVYKVRISSLDKGQAWCYVLDEDGNQIAGTLNGSGVEPRYPTLTSYLKLRGSYDKNSWFHIKLYNWLYHCSYGDRFSISVSEHPILKKVSGIKATKRANKSLSIKWSNQANASKYQVRYKAKGGSWKTKTVKANVLRLSKLKAGKQYQIKVRAYCKSGYNYDIDKVYNWSTWSNIKTIKTRAK